MPRGVKKVTDVDRLTAEIEAKEQELADLKAKKKEAENEE